MWPNAVTAMCWSGWLRALNWMMHMPQQYFLLDPKTINEHHVSMSHSLITDTYRLTDQKRVLILGCGRCREIPIEKLVDSACIDLIDIDGDALQKVRDDLTSTGINLKGVSFLNEDITGSIASLSEETDKLLKTSSDSHKSLTILTDLIDNARTVFWTPTAKYPYTLILCSLLLTQLQAFILSRLEGIFLEHFPKSRDILYAHQDWIKAKFRFARRLENGFVAHLRSLAATEAMIYVSDTVRVCFTKRISNELFSTEGSWLALKTSSLADYFDASYKIIKETSWPLFLPKIENNSDGRLYEVQALVLRLTRE